jgi:hypothetical protein
MAKKARVRKQERFANYLTALALFVAMTGLSYPLFTSTPGELAARAGSLVAAGSSAVSMSIAIPDNPYNSLAEQLKQKQIELDQREVALNGKTPVAGSTPKGAFGDNLGVYSFFISIILLVLVGINFYYDAERRKKRTPVPGKYSVDLR